MALNTITSILQFKRDLYTNFQTANPVLRAGEPAICLPDSANQEANVQHAFELRIGDGTRAFLDLPVIGSVGGSDTPEIKVDSKTIIMNAEGEIALNGFDSAAVNYMPYKGEDGKLHWMPVPESGGETDLSELVTKIDANTSAITELETKVTAIEEKLIEDYYTKNQIDSIVSSAYKPGETYESLADLPSPPTAADVGIIHPVVTGGTAGEDFVNPGEIIDNGDQIVAVETAEGEYKYTILPGGVMDISNLQDQVAQNTLDIATNTGNIGSNQQAIDNVRTDLLNNYYNKTEIDGKIPSAYTPQPSVENVSDLPTPPTGNVGDLIPVVQGGTAGSDFVNPSATINPGDKVTIVEVDGEKKYDVLPGSDIDLSGYATSSALEEGLATTVKGLSVDGTALVKNANGIVDLPMALQTSLGLVKGTSETTENGVVIQPDGSMRVVNVSVDNLVQGTDTELVISGGSANS